MKHQSHYADSGSSALPLHLLDRTSQLPAARSERGAAKRGGLGQLGDAHTAVMQLLNHRHRS